MKKADQATPNKKLLLERKKRRWYQKEVAAFIGTTRINVSRWECGLTTPSPYFRQKLNQLFDKSNEELGLVPWKPIDQDEFTLEQVDDIQKEAQRYICCSCRKAIF